MVGFSGKWLYMIATHGSMSIRVKTDHVAVKTDEKWDGNSSFRSEMLYMAPAHGTMSMRVETNHARVKIDEKRGL